jgi:hypothetical protein
MPAALDSGMLIRNRPRSSCPTSEQWANIVGHPASRNISATNDRIGDLRGAADLEKIGSRVTAPEDVAGDLCFP